jgi:uncharacterized protein
MIIGIISDTHDQLNKIDAAIKTFNGEKVEAVIHCGDFVAPFSIKPFLKLSCPFYAIYGNNDGEKHGLAESVKGFGEIFEPPHIFEINGLRFYVNHSPVDENSIKSLRCPPDYILSGHTHKELYSSICGITSINPGEACGWLSGKATVGLLNLNTAEYRNLVI